MGFAHVCICLVAAFGSLSRGASALPQGRSQCIGWRPWRSQQHGHTSPRRERKGRDSVPPGAALLSGAHRCPPSGSRTGRRVVKPAMRSCLGFSPSIRRHCGVTGGHAGDEVSQGRAAIRPPLRGWSGASVGQFWGTREDHIPLNRSQAGSQPRVTVDRMPVPFLEGIPSPASCPRPGVEMASVHALPCTVETTRRLSPGWARSGWGSEGCSPYVHNRNGCEHLVTR